jgi:hypothetical protein
METSIEAFFGCGLCTSHPRHCVILTTESLMKRFLRVTMRMPEHLLGTIIADHADTIVVESTEVVNVADKREKSAKTNGSMRPLDLLQYLKTPRTTHEIAEHSGLTLPAVKYRLLKLKKEKKVRVTGRSRAAKWRAA